MLQHPRTRQGNRQLRPKNKQPRPRNRQPKNRRMSTRLLLLPRRLRETLQRIQSKQKGSLLLLRRLSIRPRPLAAKSKPQQHSRKHLRKQKPRSSCLAKRSRTPRKKQRPLLKRLRRLMLCMTDTIAQMQVQKLR